MKLLLLLLAVAIAAGAPSTQRERMERVLLQRDEKQIIVPRDELVSSPDPAPAQKKAEHLEKKEANQKAKADRLENKKEAVAAAKACVDGTGPCDGILDAAAQAALKFNETADTAGNETAADTAGDAVAEPAGP